MSLLHNCRSDHWSTRATGRQSSQHSLSSGCSAALKRIRPGELEAIQCFSRTPPSSCGALLVAAGELVGKAWDEYADVGGYYLGNFQRERMFSKSDDPEDFLDFRDESHWVEFTITLEAFEWQTGNTMDDIPIDDEEFVI